MNAPANPVPNAYAALTRLPLFAKLPPNLLSALGAAAQITRVMPGTRLFQQGQVPAGLYLLLSGSAQELMRGPDGIERSVSDIHTGTYIAEAALFFNEASPTTVLVAKPSDVLLIPRLAFDQTLDAFPQIRTMLNPAPDIAQRLAQQRTQGARSDEHVLLFTRRHWWVIVGRLARALLLVLLLFVLAGLTSRANLLSPALPLLLVGIALTFPVIYGIYVVLEWSNDTYTVTDQRVIHDERNLLTFTQRREQALLTNVQNINVRRSGFISEALNFGDLIVSTAGVPQPVVLDRLSNPYNVQELIFDSLRKQGLTASVDPIPVPIPGGNTSLLGGIFRVLIPKIRVVEGDRITYRRHWIVLLRNILAPSFFYLLLLILLSVYFSGRLPMLNALPGSLIVMGALIWLAINTFWWYWQFADWRDDLFIVDSMSVIDVKRRPLWLQEVRIQAGLGQVQNVTSRIKGIVDRLYNKGDVIIQTAAEQGTMVFEDITDPSRTAEEVLQRVQRYQEQMRRQGR
ncbi:MAG: cyclic nucleotide-binding domain-containing protein [Anaerolineae bacterium]